MTGAATDATGRIDDGEKAYYQRPLHPFARRRPYARCPVTDSIRLFERASFGCSYSGTLFGIFSALLRAALRVLLAAPGGGFNEDAVAALTTAGGAAAELTAAVAAEAAVRGGEPLNAPHAVGGIIEDVGRRTRCLRRRRRARTRSACPRSPARAVTARRPKATHCSRPWECAACCSATWTSRWRTRVAGTIGPRRPWRRRWCGSCARTVRGRPAPRCAAK